MHHYYRKERKDIYIQGSKGETFFFLCIFGDLKG